MLPHYYSSLRKYGLLLFNCILIVTRNYASDLALDDLELLKKNKTFPSVLRYDTTKIFQRF